MIDSAGDRYRIVRKLGQGGMGEVFLAEDTRLHRRVALKKLSDTLLDDDARRTLRREARIAARLNHPNIAAIHDVIEDDDESYIVMEYVPGRTLSDRLADGPLTTQEAIDVGVQLADALHAAHAAGVVHRDLKPANIHLMPDGHVKILDFGLARMHHRSHISSRDTTSSMGDSERPGEIAGTLPYMPPEALRGDPTDGRGDIYSLGVTLYQLLTGRLPFEAQNRVALVAAVTSRNAPSATSINRAVPEPVSLVVARAMARNPGDRYATAEELRNDLKRLRSPAFTFRRALGGAVMLAALVAVTILAFSRSGDLGSAAGGLRAVAVLPFLNLSPDSTASYVAAGITDIIGTNLATLPVSVIPPGESGRYRGPDRDLPELTRELGASLVVDGSVQKYADRLRVTVRMIRAGSRKLDWSHTYDGEIAGVLGLQEEILAGLADGLVATGLLDAPPAGETRERLTTPPTSNEEAFADYTQARAFLERDDLPENIDRAISLFESAFARDSTFAQALGGLGEAYWAKYRGTRDRTWADRARETTAEAVAMDPRNSVVRASLGVILFGTGRFEDAERELTRVIEARPEDAGPHSVLGDLYERLGRKAEAIEQYKKAISLRPAYWKHHWRLATLYFNDGELDKSADEARRVTELQPDNFWGYQQLGTIYQAQGRTEEAIRNYERSLEIEPTAAAYSNIGGRFFDEGKFELAASYYRKACEIDPTHPTCRRNLGDALLELGRKDEAVDTYLTAVQLADSLLRVNPNDPNTIALQALCLAKAHRDAEALTRIKEAMALNSASPIILYKQTAILALVGKGPEALEALRKAIDAGLPPAFAASDPDLRSIADTEEFKRLVSG